MPLSHRCQRSGRGGCPDFNKWKWQWINITFARWRHQMETSSALLALCAGNSPVTGEFPSQRPVTRSCHVFFDLRLNKRLVNNIEAVDLRRHRTHYEVIVMGSHCLVGNCDVLAICPISFSIISLAQNHIRVPKTCDTTPKIIGKHIICIYMCMFDWSTISGKHYEMILWCGQTREPHFIFVLQHSKLDQSWWRHQMEIYSVLLAICAGDSPVNSPHKSQWRGALMFSLICAEINGWVNNRKAGYLRRHRAHYDVIVMIALYATSWVCIAFQ